MGKPDVSNHEPQWNMVEFSVVILAQSHNPSILNADFLRHNGIVGEQWQPHEDCLTSLMWSRVAFNGGLAVQADPIRVAFEQSGDALAADALVCASAAKGYLKTVPHVRYIAIGMNSKCISRDLSLHRVSDVLRSSGSWTTFKSVDPSFELKAIYEMGDKRVTLNVEESSHQSEPITIFRANIHRDIDEPNQQMRLNSMLSALDSWKEDLADFHALVQQYALSGET